MSKTTWIFGLGFIILGYIGAYFIFGKNDQVIIEPVNENISHMQLMPESVEPTEVTDSLPMKKVSKEEQIKLKEYFDKLNKGNTFKKNIDEFAFMNDEEQEKFKKDWFEMVNQQMGNGEISNTEALFLKLTLLKQSANDQKALTLAANLIEEYKVHSEQRWQDYLNNRDPQFTNYKEAEARVVKEILNMNQYPDGLTRQQYLQKRLEQLKKEHYSMQ